MKLLGISGSLRRGSLNTHLLKASEKIIQNATLEVVTLHGIPLYDGDLEEESGIPDAVNVLAQKIKEADGLILSTPEYNNSIPGVFKNAIDWVSRVEGDVFEGKPVAIMGASPGGFGTLLSQTAWLPVFRTLEMQLWSSGRLLVSKAHTLVDKEGNLTDEATKKKIGDFLNGFIRFVQLAP